MNGAEGNWRQKGDSFGNSGSLCSLGHVNSSTLSQRAGTEWEGVCRRIVRVSGDRTASVSLEIHLTFWSLEKWSDYNRQIKSCVEKVGE